MRSRRPKFSSCKRGELGVGHRDHGAIGRADARRVEADLLDGAGLVAEAAEVADAHRLVGEQRQAAEEILERLLGAESDGDAADAESGEQRRDVEAEAAEHADDREGDDHPLRHLARRRDEVDDASLPLRNEPLREGGAEHVDEAQDRPRRGDHQKRVLHAAEGGAGEDRQLQRRGPHGEQRHGEEEADRPADEAAQESECPRYCAGAGSSSATAVMATCENEGEHRQHEQPDPFDQRRRPDVVLEEDLRQVLFEDAVAERSRAARRAAPPSRRRTSRCRRPARSSFSAAARRSSRRPPPPGRSIHDRPAARRSSVPWRSW